MAEEAAVHTDFKIIPTLSRESLYVGVDIGKRFHVAGFLSNTLIKRHERFEACPALKFEQSREGFRMFVDRIRTYVPLEQCYVLMERTGNYHKALEQYLLELDIPVFLIHVQERPKGMLKSDKRDALTLANTLYNQLEKGIQVADKTQLVRRLHPPTEAAAQLKGLIRHRYELTSESAQRKNKLIAIYDELFPEFTEIFSDPTRECALSIREKFPTPHAIATASITALLEARVGTRPSKEKLVRLQELARETIGTKDLIRQRSLILEQTQLIKELKLISEHGKQLDGEIESIVENSREGKILTSMLVISPIQAGMIIATIGNIANFQKASELKSYFGWAPVVDASGTTLNSVSLTKGGNRIMRKTMFLMALRQFKWACLL